MSPEQIDLPTALALANDRIQDLENALHVARACLDGTTSPRQSRVEMLSVAGATPTASEVANMCVSVLAVGMKEPRHLGLAQPQH